MKTVYLLSLSCLFVAGAASAQPPREAMHITHCKADGGECPIPPVAAPALLPSPPPLPPLAPLPPKKTRAHRVVHDVPPPAPPVPPHPPAPPQPPALPDDAPATR